MNDRPTLKELCEARDKDGLEADIQGFFQAYYICIDQPNEVEIDINEFSIVCGIFSSASTQ